MSQGTADTESQEIVDNVTGVPIEVFTPSDLDALADWVEDHTGDGVPDLLIMFGIFPATIYPAGNAQPDGSLAELFLDDGNCIINTGDYIFYVGSAGNNDAGGLANMTDVPAAAMWGDDSLATTFAPTADGQLYTPSLPELPCNRPWFPAQFDGTDWYFELILGESPDGTQVQPGILRNSVTGGRLGAFFQLSDDSQPRGEVISEWINNWYVKNVDDPRLARNPSPGSDAVDVPRDVVLGWTAGSTAAAHDIYFGTNRDDVNDAERSNDLGVLASQGQAAAAYDPDGMLDFSTTYYWRVDEVNAAPDNTIFKGEPWSFTTEPFAYPVENVVATTNAVSDEGAGPENTVNGSGLNDADQHSTSSGDMWVTVPGQTDVYIEYAFDQVYKLHEMMVWNYNVQFELMLGFGLKDVTIETSVNGTDWTVLGDYELAQATAKATYEANTTIALDGLAAQYVRVNVHNGYGPLGQFGLSEVRFMYIPAHAREPEPADAATGVDVTTSLSWRAGRDAVSHEVYLGTAADALALAGTPDAAEYNPGALDLATTYYWQVTEIQDAESWQGSLWSFSTQDYLVVDDFESYNDEDNVIYDTWIDGWVNETGSTVGYLVEPFAEESIVHSGRQSMPLFYDNAGVSTSEADLDLAQDWTTSGVQSLVLYFQGDPENSVGQLYVKINNTRIDYDGSASDIRRMAWQMWSIDLSAVGNVRNVNSLTIGIEGAGAQGTLYIDDIRLYPEVLDDSPADTPDVTRAGDIVVGVPNDNDWPAAEYPALAIDDDVNTKYLHFNAGSTATGIQVEPLVGPTVVTGLTFTTANDAPTRDPIAFELSGSNSSINGPYTVIATGDIVDFAGATDWPRFTKTETPIQFNNTVAYQYYQILFPSLRGEGEALMQIAEIELLEE